MSTKYNFRKFIYNEFVVAFIALCISQIFVSYFYQHNQSTIEVVVRTVLEKNELNINPYKSAQTLDSLESIGLIACTKMISANQIRPFFDSTTSDLCKSAYLTSGSILSMRIMTGSGNEILLTTKTIINFGTFLILLIFRILFFAAGFLSVRLIKSHLDAIQKAKNTEIEISKALISNSKQVAHDIRSPLSALTMVTGSLKEIPEEKRIMIRNATQRINDIANGLLQKGKSSTADKSLALAGVEIVLSKSVEFIPALVDILVSEKRMQFREHNSLDIQTDLKNSFGAFSEINSTELKRVLSNLINNAVEAFDNFKGTIIVGVKKLNTPSGSRIEIFVTDNGKGIPAHLISKLGQMGVSHGKDSSGQSGSGLGLFHAKQTAESFGGTLEIESIEGKGSTIRFVLPLAEAPKWFAQKIDLTGIKYLISLDDDTSIHQIWAGRLQSHDIKDLEHIKFQSGEAFEKYVYTNMNKLKETLFLVDFELLNQPKTGLDLIEELGLEKYSILITSRYEEKDIQERASRIRLLLLPKALAGFVPFEIQKPKLKFDAVLLDDDDLVIATWQMAAREYSKSILCFANREELFSKLSEIDPACPFYIDENLGNGVRGEDITKDLFELGFRNLYLSTGYPAEQFKHVTWLKGVLSKDPPFMG